MRDGEELEQLGIVVTHFLEMRDQPALIHGVAGKTAAEMIVDAALANMVQRHIDGSEIARHPAAQSAAQKKFEHASLRKLPRAAGAAVDRIDHAAELARGVT